MLRAPRHPMELTDAIYQRRAVRHYTPDPVPTTALELLLKAALHAPSAVNQQPWAFGIVRGQDLLADAFSCNVRGMGPGLA